MKEDQIDKFIRQNRAEFDSEVPSPQIWNEIDKTLDKQQRPTVVRNLPSRQWLSIAATLLLVLSIGFWLGQSQGINSTKNQWANFELSETFNQSESYMKHLANEKQVSLASFSPHQSIIDDLGSMDDNYEIQKQMLLQKPGITEEYLTRLMITHYKRKIALLEQILDTQSFFSTEQNKINLEDGILQ